MPGSMDRKMSLRKTGESQFFNLHTLRRLYNPENQGRGTEGKSTRFDIHPTITRITFLMLTKVVPVGKGRYGSPVMELALRVLLAVATRSIPIQKVAEELCLSVLDRSTLVLSLKELTIEVQRYALQDKV